MGATKQLKPRPVWARHLRRTMQNTQVIDDPTEEEKRDAILVLADPSNSIVHGLWIEAHRIFDEASV